MIEDPCVPPFLFSSARFGIQMGLMRMKSLMKRLGNPEESLRCYHVAGTNGKGSTVAFLSSCLATAGFRTGIYTSPYIERFSERIRVLDGLDGAIRYAEDDTEGEITQDRLFSLSDRVEEAVSGMLSNGEEHPTEFELVTALAFLYFKEKNCDFVVLETGLGGRLDSTNIIEKPVATIITALGYDHMDLLGSSMREIAGEKAGIIKKNSPVFLYNPSACGLSETDAGDAYSVIAEQCKKLDTELVVVSPGDIIDQKTDPEGQSFRLSFFPEELRICLLGDHQGMNAAISVRVLRHTLSDEVILRGMALARWKARLEVLSRHPLILLDGGHNPQGAQAFRSSVDSLFTNLFQQNPPRLILGFMRDKDISGILTILLQDMAYPIREILCVTVDNLRAIPSNELRERIEQKLSAFAVFYKNKASMYNRQGMVFAYDHVSEGCKAALKSSDRDDAPILCMGSLYLAGEARHILLTRNEGDIS